MFREKDKVERLDFWRDFSSVYNAIVENWTRLS